MTFKYCTKCLIKKPLSDFHKKKDSTDKHHSQCKSCKNKAVKLYSRTKNGIITKIYKQQRQSSIERGYEIPEYNLSQLREFAFKQSIFHELYDAWVQSGYEKDLIPSFDRTDDYQGYSFDRLQIVTWRENFDKWRADTKSGINNKLSKPVIQLSRNGDFINEFYSQSEASRITGIAKNGICACCTGREKTAGGFKWENKSDD